MRILMLAALLGLTACATEAPPTVYVPAEIDKAVTVPCKAPTVPRPADLLLALPVTASLTQGMKSCLAQHEYDLGYQAQLEASVAACQ